MTNSTRDAIGTCDDCGAENVRIWQTEYNWQCEACVADDEPDIETMGREVNEWLASLVGKKVEEMTFDDWTKALETAGLREVQDGR